MVKQFVTVLHPNPEDSLTEYQNFPLLTDDEGVKYIEYQKKHWKIEVENTDSNSEHVERYRVVNYKMPFLYWLESIILKGFVMVIFLLVVLLVVWNIFGWLFLDYKLAELPAFIVTIWVVTFIRTALEK